MPEERRADTITRRLATDHNQSTTSTAITTNDYASWDTQRLSQITIATTGAQNTDYTSNFFYNSNGHLKSVDIVDGRPRTVNYVTDSLGQVIKRTETLASEPNAAVKPTQLYYNFDGMRVGDISNDGPSAIDYATAVNERLRAAPTGAFRNAIGAVQAANFDQGYEAITPGSQGLAPTSQSYIVRDGDTLRTIAKLFWGDESLWYLIADANGYGGSEALPAGSVLIIPSKVVNVHNKNTTFRVYDPNKALGNTQPNQPEPVAQVAQVAPPRENGCKRFGQILLIVVAVVVTALVLGPATSALTTLFNGGVAATAAAPATAFAVAAGTIGGGALAGAAGSIASQGLGVLTGLQDRIDWKGVGMAAIQGGVAAGLGGSSSALGNIKNPVLQAAARGAAGSVITQGIATAVGLQRRFDWNAVAMDAVSAGTMKFVGDAIGGRFKPGTMANQAVTGAAGAIAGAATRSVLDGSDFGDNIMSALPGVIGNTIGNMVAGRILAVASGRNAVRGGSSNDDLKSGGNQGERTQLEPYTASDPIGIEVIKPATRPILEADFIPFPQVDLGGRSGGGAVSNGFGRSGTTGVDAVPARGGSVRHTPSSTYYTIPSYDPTTNQELDNPTILRVRSGDQVAYSVESDADGHRNFVLDNYTQYSQQKFLIEQGRTYTFSGGEITFGSVSDAPSFQAGNGARSVADLVAQRQSFNAVSRNLAANDPVMIIGAVGVLAAPAVAAAVALAPASATAWLSTFLADTSGGGAIVSRAALTNILGPGAGIGAFATAGMQMFSLGSRADYAAAGRALWDGDGRLAIKYAGDETGEVLLGGVAGGLGGGGGFVVEALASKAFLTWGPKVAGPLGNVFGGALGGGLQSNWTGGDWRSGAAWGATFGGLAGATVSLLKVRGDWLPRVKGDPLQIAPYQPGRIVEGLALAANVVIETAGQIGQEATDQKTRLSQSNSKNGR